MSARLVPITVEMGTKLIRLRYAGTCSQCASVLAPDTRGWWDSEARTATCVDCHPAEDDSRVQVAAPDQIQGITNSDSITPLATGEAGASARQMFEQKHRRREERIERKWGRLAGVVKFVSTDPQSARAWANGSTGERRLASLLVKSLGDRAALLHDRKIPGSRANIDHLAIAASGIWIIDAKNYTGKVEQRDVGGLFSTDQRLYVNGHDYTELVAGFAWQINAVLEAIGDAEIHRHADQREIEAAKIGQIRRVGPIGRAKQRRDIGEGPFAPLAAAELQVCDAAKMRIIHLAAERAAIALA